MKIFSATTQGNRIQTLDTFRRNIYDLEDDPHKILDAFEVLGELQTWGPMELEELHEWFTKPTKGPLISSQRGIQPALRTLITAGLVKVENG